MNRRHEDFQSSLDEFHKIPILLIFLQATYNKRISSIPYGLLITYGTKNYGWFFDYSLMNKRGLITGLAEI